MMKLIRLSMFWHSLKLPVALTEYATTANLTPGKFVTIAAKNIVTGPVKAVVNTFKLTRATWKWKYAFEFTADELKMKLLSGELSEVEVRSRCANAKLFADNIGQKGSWLYKRFDKIHNFDEYLSLSKIASNDAQLRLARNYLDTGIKPTSGSGELHHVLEEIYDMENNKPETFLKLINGRRIERLLSLSESHPNVIANLLASFNEGTPLTDETIAKLKELKLYDKLEDIKKYINQSDSAFGQFKGIERVVGADGKVTIKINGKIIKVGEEPSVFKRLKIMRNQKV